MPVSSGKTELLPCNLCGSKNFKPALNCEGFSFVMCKRCGLVQRNPQPLKEEIIARYSDIYGKDYLSYEIENEASFLNLQQLALKDAGFFQAEKVFFMIAGQDENKTPSVLDIGCATGSLLAFLREKGWRVIGVEISPAAEYARNERRLDVRSLPLEENNFPSGSFDIVLASHLIEHLNNPRGFLNEVYRVLKDNGYFFITTPNISGFQAHLFKDRWRSAIFDHLYLFSKRTLLKMMKDAGFKPKRLRTWGGLAAGMAPAWLKKTADKLAKRLRLGDVMIVKAGK